MKITLYEVYDYGLKYTSSDPKKVAFVFFATESLSNPGKGMIITKM
jgi:hypothetical protein